MTENGAPMTDPEPYPAEDLPTIQLPGPFGRLRTAGGIENLRLSKDHAVPDEVAPLLPPPWLSYEPLHEEPTPLQEALQEVIRAQTEWAASLPVLPPGYGWSYAMTLEDSDGPETMLRVTATPQWEGLDLIGEAGE